jgi:hypothetical protein
VKPVPQWIMRGSVRQVSYALRPAGYFEFIGVNHARYALRDPSVRRGLTHVMNLCEAVSSLYLAHASRAAGPLGAEFPPPEFDPAQAPQLLRPLRLATRAASPLVIIANENNRERAEIARLFAAALSERGIHARAEILPAAEYFARLESGEFCLFVGGLELPDGTAADVFFDSGLFPEDAVLAAAFAEFISAATLAEYTAAAENFHAAFLARAPVIGLAFRHNALITGPRITPDAWELLR